MFVKLSKPETQYYEALRDRLRQLPDYVADDINETRTLWCTDNHYNYVKLLALRVQCPDLNRVRIIEEAFASVETVEALLADRNKDGLEDVVDSILLRGLHG
ncbi:hypothetical protein [Buttiauxella noackiae]|uniref:hypothetical protein n=1 Tax=Buttiauxella noackiae TaxID=82992 RepID=UPI0005503F2F|nr:hypothetical protein [Buttiauxella noackiae]